MINDKIKRMMVCAWTVLVLAFLSLSGFASIPKHSRFDPLEWHGAGGVGGLVSMNVHTGTNAGSYFYVYDGNRNVTASINVSNGLVAAEYEYVPFGEPIRVNGPMGFANPFRFSTKYHDDETGLVYYGCRYWNSNTGKWISRDLGSQRANYYQSSSVLRKAVRDGYEIRDASVFRPNSELAPTLLRPDRTVGQTFFGAERLILDNKGLQLGPSGAYVPK